MSGSVLNAIREKRERKKEIDEKYVKTLQRRHEQITQGILLGNAAGVALVGSILGGIIFTEQEIRVPIFLVVILTLYVLGAGCVLASRESRFIALGAEFSSRAARSTSDEKREEGEKYALLHDSVARFFEYSARAFLSIATASALGWLWVKAIFG